MRNVPDLSFCSVAGKPGSGLLAVLSALSGTVDRRAGLTSWWLAP